MLSCAHYQRKKERKKRTKPQLNELLKAKLNRCKKYGCFSLPRHHLTLHSTEGELSTWLSSPLLFQGFSGGSHGKDCLKCRRRGVDPWVRKISWRREWLPILVFWPGECHGQRSLVSPRPWGHKESDMTEQLNTSLLPFQVGLNPDLKQDITY